MYQPEGPDLATGPPRVDHVTILRNVHLTTFRDGWIPKTCSRRQEGKRASTTTADLRHLWFFHAIGPDISNTPAHRGAWRL